MHIKEIHFSVEVNGRRIGTQTFVNEKAWENNPAYRATTLEAARQSFVSRLIDMLDIEITMVETEIPDVRKK